MPCAPTGVLICPSSIVAEVLLTGLKAAGVDLAALSLIAREAPLGAAAGALERRREPSTVDTCWGAIVGLLLESASYPLPGGGAVKVAGPFTSVMAAASAHAAAGDGASAVGAGLAQIGMRGHCVQRYEAALAAGRLLLIVQGSTGELLRIRLLLGSMGHQLELHQAAAAQHAAQATTIIMGPLSGASVR